MSIPPIEQTSYVAQRDGQLCKEVYQPYLTFGLINLETWKWVMGERPGRINRIRCDTQ